MIVEFNGNQYKDLETLIEDLLNYIKEQASSNIGEYIKEEVYDGETVEIMGHDVPLIDIILGVNYLKERVAKDFYIELLSDIRFSIKIDYDNHQLKLVYNKYGVGVTIYAYSSDSDNLDEIDNNLDELETKVYFALQAEEDRINKLIKDSKEGETKEDGEPNKEEGLV